LVYNRRMSPRLPARLVTVLLLAGLLAACGGSTAGSVSLERGARAAVPLAPAGCEDSAPGVRTLAESPPLGRLGAEVRPTAVELSLDIDPRAERFSGTETIHLELGSARRVLWLHGKELDVTTVSIESHGVLQRGAYEQVDDTGVARITFPCDVAPGPAALRLAWSAPFLTGGDGIFKVTRGADSYVFTQFEPISARAGFPGFDEPAFKVPYTLTLVVAQGDVAVSNALVASETPASDGKRTLVFEPTPPLPTYLVAFAVGPLEIVEAPPIPPNAIRSEPLRFRALAMRGRGPKLAYAMSRVPAIVAALERYFGTPYPYSKLDFVAIDDFPGAMENAGLITFQEWYLLLDGAGAPEYQRRWSENTIAHELSHQWFGNVVTMAWWDDLWLNEGFATWIASRIVDEVAPELGADEMRIDEWRGAMSDDSRASARRIRQPIRSHHDIAAAFDGITYSKGGAVIGMFERWLGEEKFRTGVRAYLEAHRLGTATADDLLGALSAAGGRDVRTPFSTFLDQVGAPAVSMTLSCASGAGSLALSQQRWLPIGSAAAHDVLWQVPVCVRYGRGAAAREACTLLTETRGTLALPPLAGGCPEWVAPNASGAGYYQGLLDTAALAQVRTRGLSRLTMRERASLADGVLAATESGALAPVPALAALEPLARDTARPVAMAPTDLLRFFWQYAPDAAARARVEGIVRRLYGARGRALGWRPRANEDGSARQLRADVLSALAWRGRDPQVRREAARLGRAYLGVGTDGALHPEAVPSDLVDLALDVAVADGDDAVFEAVEARLFASEDPIVRERMLTALGSATDAARATRARELTLDPRLAATEVQVILYAQLAEPETREGAYDWLESSFDAFAARVPEWSGGSLPGYGRGFCDAAHAARLEAFFRPRVANLSGGPQTLATTLEEIGLCAARLSAQGADAAEFR
jgi:alanyl aminopeptidase